jgi:methionyl-tRNA synthetase
MKKVIYITTPIYYVNAKPHIGHAYTTIVCDVFARFHKMLGYNVKFSTGTDEHGKKVEQSANDAKVSPQDFTDGISSLFKDLLPILNISNDDFIRTTEPRHKKTVMHFWKKLRDAGYIYLGEYSGWYDMRNEAYFSENELIDGKSPLGGEVQYMTEPCYFFKLSAFENRLLKFYDENPNFIYPVQKKNEIISFIKQGLKDLAVSRTTFNWGIPVPDDPKHVVYVWLDALTNYLTLNGYPDNEDQNADEYWQNVVHFVGKEIVRFHALYWPAFLMAAGISPPKRIVSHGWWLSEGEKMSKSLGNVQDPHKYCNLFGSDALRYFMLRELSFGLDGNFSLESFINRYNSALANAYGNLCNRVFSFITKHCAGMVKRPKNTLVEDIEFIDEIDSSLNDSVILVQQYAFSKYLEKIEYAISIANQYVDSQKPWALKLSKPERMQDILFILTEQIYKITKFFYPVIPIAAEKVLKQINSWHELKFVENERIQDIVTIVNPEVLFPRIDIAEIEKFDVYAKG